MPRHLPTVLVPSPAHYATRLADAFARLAHHVGVMQVPFIESVPLFDSPDLTALACHLDKYDFIVLPSRMAIDTFAKVCHSPSAKCQFTAMGKDFDHLLKALNPPRAAEPNEPSPAGIVELIANQPNAANMRVAVLSPRFAQLEEPSTIPDMIGALAQVVAQVDRVDGYETRPTNKSSRQQAYDAIENGEIDVVAFTSAGEVFAFLQDASPIPITTRVACFGPYTARRAQQAGLRVDFVPSAFASFDDYVHGLSALLRD